jgi:hypothetical protein
VLDPFCGTGTTVVECKKQGIPSVGIEVNPVAQFAWAVKTDWAPDADGLLAHGDEIAAIARAELRAQGIEDDPSITGRTDTPTLPARLRILPPEPWSLLLTNSISPLPLHKTLPLLDVLKQQHDDCYHRHELLPLANALPFSISNLRFGPEIGLGAIKLDTSVVGVWLDGVRAIAADLRNLSEGERTGGCSSCRCAATSRRARTKFNRHRDYVSALSE